MKICIVGAGAIGGMLGVKLALTGHDVTLILRGANLEAVKANGLTLIEENGNGEANDFLEPDLYEPPAVDTGKPKVKTVEPKKPEEKKDNGIPPKATMKSAGNDKKNIQKPKNDNDY